MHFWERSQLGIRWHTCRQLKVVSNHEDDPVLNRMGRQKSAWLDSRTRSENSGTATRSSSAGPDMPATVSVVQSRSHAGLLLGSGRDALRWSIAGRNI